MESIEAYFRRHSGRAFLLGNGRSLADHLDAPFNPEETITMNRSWIVVPNALYHCMNGDMRTRIGHPKHIIFLGHKEQYGDEFSLGCPIIHVTAYSTEAARKIKQLKDLGIPAEFDLRQIWPTAGISEKKATAGLLAVYAAWFLGFREVYLIGYDGYGGHFTKADWNLTPSHAWIVPQFVHHTNKLLEYDPDFRLYNCNPDNAYGNLPYKSVEAAINGD